MPKTEALKECLALLHCNLLTTDDVDASWQILQRILNAYLFLDECPLGIVDVYDGAGCLQILNAGFDAVETGYVLDFERGGSGILLVPGEAATGGQKGFVCLCADEDALKDMTILLCRNAVASVNLQTFPAAAKGDLIAVVVAHADTLEGCVYGL